MRDFFLHLEALVPEILEGARVDWLVSSCPWGHHYFQAFLVFLVLNHFPPFISSSDFTVVNVIATYIRENIGLPWSCIMCIVHTVKIPFLATKSTPVHFALLLMHSWRVEGHKEAHTLSLCPLFPWWFSWSPGQPLLPGLSEIQAKAATCQVRAARWQQLQQKLLSMLCSPEHIQQQQRSKSRHIMLSAGSSSCK